MLGCEQGEQLRQPSILGPVPFVQGTPSPCTSLTPAQTPLRTTASGGQGPHVGLERTAVVSRQIMPTIPRCPRPNHGAPVRVTARSKRLCKHEDYVRMVRGEMIRCSSGHNIINWGPLKR